jgi:hypothetical protein
MYLELLEKYEKRHLLGLVNNAAHQARLAFVKWLEENSGLTPAPLDACACPPEIKFSHEHEQDPYCSKCGKRQ